MWSEHGPVSSSILLPLVKYVCDFHWRSCHRRLPHCARTQLDRTGVQRLNQLLLDLVTPPEMELLRVFFVFVDRSAISPAKLHGMRSDSGQYRFQLQSRANGLTDLTQRSQLTNRLCQLARPRLEFLKQPNVLNGDHRLIGERF